MKATVPPQSGPDGAGFAVASRFPILYAWAGIGVQQTPTRGLRFSGSLLDNAACISLSLITPLLLHATPVPGTTALPAVYAFPMFVL